MPPSDEPTREDVGRPSQLFRDALPALVDLPTGRPALDLACGRGRHSMAAACAGIRVVAVDRSRAFLDALADVPVSGSGSIAPVLCDLEAGFEPPLREGVFGAILVFRYLHRPLMPWIERALAPGGLLVYETFTVAQRSLGWGPGRDEFLLHSGELSALFPSLEVLRFEEGESADEPPAQTARLLARRPD